LISYQDTSTSYIYICRIVLGLGRVVLAGREDGVVELRQHCVLTGLLLPPPRRRVLLRRRRLADQRALLGLGTPNRPYSSRSPCYSLGNTKILLLSKVE
jgi:hypothetical protein